MHPIAGIASWFVLLVPFILLSVDVITAADDLEKQRQALNIIVDYASRICVTVPQTGKSGNVELSGKAKAELNELLKKIANLGIEGAAQYQALQYEGVLQKELAEQLNKSRDCQREVSQDLINRLLPPLSKVPSRQEPRPVPSPTPSTGARQLPPKRPGPWAAQLIGSWKTDGRDENNIPATMVYTFNPDGSFLSIEGNYGESRGRFEYARGHVLIEWDSGTNEYAELLLMGNQFRYRIEDHTDQRQIGQEFIFQRLRR
jgi:hypothetical protein